jgi:endonuclease/exonuclease/phosphatase family metal-dependent hydrolase
MLASMGAHSAYQLVHGPLGPELGLPTLRRIGPGRKHHHYHRDYIFVSAALASSVRSAEVGSLTDWVETGLSDHCPVVAELANESLPALPN